MKLVKSMAGETGIKYRILENSDGIFELQYRAPMFPGSLKSEWKYCGDYDSIDDAINYQKRRDSLVSGGDTVML